MSSSFISESTRSAPPLIQPQYEIIASEDRISQLPEEIIFQMFDLLTARELVCVSQVSRRWKRLASDGKLWNTPLTKIFPTLKVFDSSDWSNYIKDLPSHGLSTAGELPNRAYISILKQRLTSLSIENNAGLTLLTIPKGLTVNKIKQLGESMKGIRVQWGNYAFFKKLGDIPAERTYRILITNNVLERSRELTTEAQKEFVQALGWRCPKFLEATTLLITTFIKTDQRLTDLCTYTICEEIVFPHDSAVGGFSPGADKDLLIGPAGFDGPMKGIFAVLDDKFPLKEPVVKESTE